MSQLGNLASSYFKNNRPFPIRSRKDILWRITYTR